jgi:pSer/pThr/pTyr-binding forkhead associated (FHA) protein
MIGSSRPIIAAGVPACRLVAKQFGKETTTTFPLHGSVVVGRFDPTTGPVDVDLSGIAGSEHVSRHHAKVEPRGDQWIVRDMQSANGVFVRKNGSELFGPRVSESELHDGDEIAFGQVVVVFRVGGS